MTLQLQRSPSVSGNEPEIGRSQEVVAHVYDVACSGPDGGGGGATVLNINRIFKDAIGLGGIFHTAIQVYGDEEWSFGYCEHGSGVFSCPPSKNPMYTFRESIMLGNTSCSMLTVNRIVRELSREWPGSSYEILSRNCNHFCNELCDKLDVPKLPGWVNRFANAGDAAVEAAEITAVKLKQAKKEIFTACKSASTYLTGAPSSSTPSDVEETGGTTGGTTSSSLFEGTWIGSIIGISMKPSRSLVNDDESSSSDDKTSDDESEPGDKQPSSNQNADQKDAAQEQDQKSENEPDHHP